MKNWNANTKVTDLDIKTIIKQFEAIDNSISIMRDRKPQILASYRITRQTFHARKALLDK